MEEKKRLLGQQDAFNKVLTDMKEASKKLHGETKFRSVDDVDKAIEVSIEIFVS